MGYTKCAMGGMSGTSKKSRFKVGDSVVYKAWPGVRRRGVVIDIDKDKKYMSVRNNAGGIDYMETRLLAADDRPY